MKDLTQGSLLKHLITMAVPIAIGMLVQTLYFLIDLYFVGLLGKQPLAGVAAANSVLFLTFALTQILNVGISALIAQSLGRKDTKKANHLFNQSMYLSIVMGLITLALGYSFSGLFMNHLSQDPEVVAYGVDYLHWLIPGLVIQVLTTSLIATLRAAGIVNPAMAVQLVSVVINVILSPILIHGYFFGVALGVAGASIATSIASLIGLSLLWRLFKKSDTCFSLSFSENKIDFNSWKHVLTIGFPAGGEFLLMFVYMSLIYWCIQDFGADAHAGFGIGMRVMQTLFLPAVSLAFALPAIIGQNFGAKDFSRVKSAFIVTLKVSCLLMLSLTIISRYFADLLVALLSDDGLVIAVASIFLVTVSWNFIPSAIIFACSGVFQGLGNTWPSLIASSTRLLTFAIPAIWYSHQPNFELEHLWNLSVATVFFQCLMCLILLHLQLRAKLRQ